MQVYIKAYYTFAVYFLLCSFGWGAWLTHEVIWNKAARSNAGLIAVLITYAGLAFALLKGVVSIQACHYYGQGLPLTVPQQDVFMACWWYVVFFAAGGVLYCAYVIQPYNGHDFSYFNSHLKAKLIDSCMLLGTIASIYFTITDLILLKSIRKKYEESLFVFQDGDRRNTSA